MTLTGIRKYIFVFLFAAIPFSLLLVGQVGAQGVLVKDDGKTKDPLTILELFTASDCYGCILGESAVYKFSQENNVIALSCHVDGYLGDNGYSQKSADFCADRQWYYNEKFMTDGSSIYLPQMVINGGYPFKAIKQNTITSQMKAGRQTVLPIELKMLDDSRLQIFLPEGHRNHKVNNPTYLVTVIRYADSAVNKVVPKGRTEPRVIRYTNIIQDLRHVGKWYGEERNIITDLKDFPEGSLDVQGGWVALVQKQNGASIIAAGHLSD